MNVITQNRFAVNSDSQSNFEAATPNQTAVALAACGTVVKHYSPFRLMAETAIECGWSPIPRRAKPAKGRPAKDAKRPAIDEWQQLCRQPLTYTEMTAYFRALPDAHISVATGYAGTVWFDLDTDDADFIAAYRSVIPESFIARIGSKGRADAYRVIGDLPASRKLYPPNNKAPLLEIMADGCNIVVPPSIHPETGNVYTWIGEASIYDTLPDELPVITAEQVERLIEVLAPWLRKPKVVEPSKKLATIDPAGLSEQHRKRYQAMADKAFDTQMAKLAGSSKGQRNRNLYSAICALGVFVHHGFLDQQMVEDSAYALCSANKLVKENGEKDVRNTIADGLAKAAGDCLPELVDRPLTRAKRSKPAAPVYEAPRQAEPEPFDYDGAPEFSEEGLALTFAAKHKDNLRYVAPFASWMFWTGQVWREEETHLAFDLARKHCREEGKRAADPKDKASLNDAKTRANVLTLARADRAIAATKDQWNADNWSLNTPGGIVDLKTGKLQPHDPSRYMTKMATVTPGGDCPKWREFLDTVTDCNPELERFLQRVAGYCLTGETTEHALFFCHGKGGNGKGVFLNTITGIMSAYARPAPIETFTESKNDRHPTELAGLVGARLVTASETEEGRHWAEAKVKQLTGGDPVSARFMRGDFFEYVPNFKLFIVGNHKPQIRNVDDAMRRRFHLIPFTVTIPDEKKNPLLTQELRAEWGSILQWMIEGCLEWQRIGLAPPADVKAATAEYMEAEDSTAAWLDEMTMRSSGTEQLAALMASWTKWADFNRVAVGSNKKLKAKLEDRGFTFGKNEKGICVNGLSLRQDIVYSGRWSE